MSATATASVPTPMARRYLGELCKHFEQRCPVELGEGAGAIRFTIGECRLLAEPERLHLALEAPDAVQLEQLQEVVARHLLRFAYRDITAVEWLAR
jgi:uncharacterized protein